MTMKGKVLASLLTGMLLFTGSAAANTLVSADITADCTEYSITVVRGTYEECVAEYALDINGSMQITGTFVVPASTVTLDTVYESESFPLDLSCGEYELAGELSLICSTAADGNPQFFGPVAVICPCDEEGCTLTQGYWKTHSQYGPAPYDPVWAVIGEDTAFYLSGKTWYEVLWTPPRKGNAYYILAHQYIAARLNEESGASTDAISQELADALALFVQYTPAEIGALKGDSELRAQFVDLGEILDAYNKGDIGPGHCAD